MESNVFLATSVFPLDSRGSSASLSGKLIPGFTTLFCGTRPFSHFPTCSRAENMVQAVCQAGDSSKNSRNCSLCTFPIISKGLSLGYIAVRVLTERVYSTQESVSQRLLVRIPDRAETLGIGRSKISELIATGELPTIHVGRAVRISASTLHKWVEERE